MVSRGGVGEAGGGDNRVWSVGVGEAGGGDNRVFCCTLH